jgi:hypothetical protein
MGEVDINRDHSAPEMEVLNRERMTGWDAPVGLRPRPSCSGAATRRPGVALGSVERIESDRGSRPSSAVKGSRIEASGNAACRRRGQVAGRSPVARWGRRLVRRFLGGTGFDIH